MTNIEAIKILKDKADTARFTANYKELEAFELAINALEALELANNALEEALNKVTCTRKFD